MQQLETSGRFQHMVFEGMARPARASSASRRPAVRAAMPAPADAGEVTEPAVMAFLAQVLRRAHLEVSVYRVSPMLRRLPACLRALRVGSVEQATAVLAEQPELWLIAIDCLLIGTTSFYRDANVFDALREQFLPRIAIGRDGLDVWSVACSEGAELRTMAVLLAEMGLLGRSRLRGTDCRPRALAAARRGRYAATAINTLPGELRERYYTTEGGVAVPCAELQTTAFDWQLGNALNIAAVEAWDVVLCRNLAIYLDAVTTGHLWSALARALRPGGIVVVGKAERPADPSLVRVGPCIYRKEPSRRLN